MDIRIKTILKFIINLVFALYNCVLGIAVHSWWFMASGAYYIILSIMRITVIAFSSGNRKNDGFIMNFTAVMILFLSVILCGMVYMTIEQDVAAEYHEIVMITIALYAFVKISLAICGFVKSGKRNLPYIKTLSSITLADAIVSIYSLQRSMLVSFEGMSSGDIILFNTLSGIGMCIAVVFTGINLLRKENKNGAIKNRKKD